MNRKIEDLNIDLLPSPKGEVAYYGSRHCSKLQLAVKKSGRKEWRFRYTRPDGVRSTFTIGTFPAISEAEAKQQIAKLEAELKKGISPVAAKVVARTNSLIQARSIANLVGGRYTFINMADAFLQDIKKRGKPGPETLKKYRTGLLHHLQPVIGYWDVRNIPINDYKEIIVKIAQDSPSAANNTHASFRAMMTWLVQAGTIYGNPLFNLRDILKDTEVNPRTRYLSPSEIHIFLNELPRQRINDETKLALLIQIHTGLRIGEICSLEWSKIDFRARLITHPKTVMKSGKAAETVMSDAVFRLLAERRKLTLNETQKRVFPEGFNTDHVIEQVQKLKGWIDFGTHDLRRTVSTYLQEFGCPLDVREKITNHAEPKGVRRSYDHSKALKQQLTWLNLLGAKLAEIKVNPSAVDIGIGLDDSDPLMAEFADIL